MSYFDYTYFSAKNYKLHFLLDMAFLKIFKSSEKAAKADKAIPIKIMKQTNQPKKTSPLQMIVDRTIYLL